nr:retrovirus-related Pol polyprotein from transposon TNT 1-94 [Tanacetum cinerariifolium]
MSKLEDITYSDDEEYVGAEADFTNLETSITVSPIPTTRVHKDHHVTQIIGDLSSATQTRSMTRVVKDHDGLTQINNEDFHTCMFVCFLSQEEPKRVHQALKDPSWIEAMQEELLQFKMQKVWILVDLPNGKRAIGTKWVFRNKKDERGIVVRNKARIVAQGHTQEEGINYEEVFAPVARIEAKRLFLAYASFMGFMVYQMDVKSAFLYETIEEEVYFCQPPGFEDPDYPNKVGKTDQTLFIKTQKGDILLVQIYVDDIIFGSTNKDLCKAFEKLMKDKFQMSSMGELTFFLGLQVKQKPDGIFISQDKYVAEILRKFGLTDGKSASTPIDTKKHLLKDPDGEDVDVHTYISMIGSLMYFTSSRPDIMFAEVYNRGLSILWMQIDLLAMQKEIVATSSTEAEYVAATIDEKVGIEVCAIDLKVTAVRLIVTAVNDVMRLQALVDKKKVMITEATIREALRLDDAESIDCLPNEEIFTELSRMGYEKLSTKLTFSVICLSTSRKFNFSKYIFDSLDRKGFSRVDTPLFEGMIVAQQADDVADEGVAGVDVNVVPAADDEPSIPSPTPTAQPPPPSQELPSTSQDKIAQTLEITKLKQKVKKLERRNKLKVSKLRRLKKVRTAQRIDTSEDVVMDDVSKQRGIITNLDAYEDVTLKDVADIAKEVDVDAEIEENADDDELEPAELKKVVEVVTTTKLMTKVVTAASATITAADTPITAATMTVAPSAARRRKGVDEVIEQFQRKEKEDNVVMRYQALKRKPQTEAQARKNMMIYLRNMVGFKMYYLKGMSYDDIRLIFEKKFNTNMDFLEKTKEQMEEEDNKALKRASESQAEKAAKKQKLDEEVKELKKHLQGDVYTEATPLARKVPVVDYEIYTENNKPYYKIIRADGSPQLFLSFLSLLRNFNREDLEVLWQLVKERFASSKPKNSSDDFLLTTLTYMFEKPNVQAQVWKNQRSVHGLEKVKSWRLLESCGVHIITFTTTQMILLVERRYPLSRFTLDQMLNNVRLEVEEESEVSLELLRFMRQQQQEGFRPE